MRCRCLLRAALAAAALARSASRASGQSLLPKPPWLLGSASAEPALPPSPPPPPPRPAEPPPAPPAPLAPLVPVAEDATPATPQAQAPHAQVADATPATPRVHIYDLPPHLLENCHHFGCLLLTPHLRASRYYEPDPAKADLFLIPHQMPFRDASWATEAYEYIRTHWPYLNRSIAAKQTRHFISLTCDHGAGDCSYVDRPIRLASGVPSFFNPPDPARVVGHLQWNGMRDGHDAGQTECLVCFQEGKDIQLVTAQNVCGPLCGYTKDALVAHSVWSGADEQARARKAAAHAAGRPPRRTLFFYGGRIHAARGDKDASGRAQLLQHVNASGFRIVNTMQDDDPDAPPPEEQRALYRSFAVEMSDAEFCYSPLGQFEGDTDRYVAAIMFGCVPVMLKTTRYGGGQVPMAHPLEEHPELDWRSFSIGVTIEELDDLPGVLSRVTPHARMRLRHALARVWRRFLWSGMYGSYLGEDAATDAFESLMDVLRARAAALPPLPLTD